MTLPSASKQSENMTTQPYNRGQRLFTVTRIQLIVIRRISSTLYVLAPLEASAKVPTILSFPSLHSKIKATEHKFGISSHI